MHIVEKDILMMVKDAKIVQRDFMVVGNIVIIETMVNSMKIIYLT